MKYINMYITQNDIISGIIKGSISCTISRKYKHRRSIIRGAIAELIVPSHLKEIYNDDVTEKSVFNVIIARNGTEKITLKDVFIFPRPRVVFHAGNEKIVIVQNFEFRSW